MPVLKSFKLNDSDVESKTFVNNVLSLFFFLLGFMLFGCFVIVLKYYETNNKWEDRDVFIFKLNFSIV